MKLSRTICVITLSAAFLFFGVSAFAQLPMAGQQAAPAQTASAGQKIALKTSRKAGSMDKIVYQQDILGKLMIPSSENSDKLPAGAKKPEKTTVKTANGSSVEMDVYPVKALTKFQYTEKTVFNGQENNTFSIKAIRNYQAISVERTVDNETNKIELPDEKKTLNVDVKGAKVTFFHKQYCMTQDELDALEVIAPSLTLETLLPAQPVAIGEKWSVSDDALGTIFQLDSMKQVQVVSTLSEIDAKRNAMIDVQGLVMGEIDGVQAVINFKLRYRFNLIINRITWAGMVTKEERRSGPITPDLAIETRVNMTIMPAAPAEDAKLAAEQWTEPTEELLLMHYTSLDGTWTMFHDRRWCIFKNEPDQVIFRFMHQGEYIAQCVINKTNNPDSTKDMTLEKFKKEVEDAVMEENEKTRKIVAVNEEMSPSNVNVFQVVATDSADGAQWGYYMLKGAKASQQLVFMFMLDGNKAEAIGETDMQMIGTLEFKD